MSSLVCVEVINEKLVSALLSFFFSSHPEWHLPSYSCYDFISQLNSHDGEITKDHHW